MKKIKDKIQELRDQGYFGLKENYPEDFVPDRTSWGDLEDNYNKLYYTLMEIEDDDLTTI